MSFPSSEFINAFNKAYKNEIILIAEQIATKFDLDLCDVINYVESILNNTEKPQEKKKEVTKTDKKKIILDDEPIEEAKEEKKETKKKTEKVDNPHEGKTCQHKMTAGKKKGELCGDKVHIDSKTGIYCKTHLKNEAGNKFLQSTLNTNGEATVVKGDKGDKKEEKKVTKKKEEGPLINNNANIKEVIEQRTSQITIKKNKKWNIYEHPETGLVIDPLTKEVVGKLNDDNGLVAPLTPEDIDLAKTLGFKKIKIPDNLPTKKIEKSELYDDEDDDEDDISDVEDDDEEEDDE